MPPPNDLSLEAVQKVARLARLNITGAQAQTLRSEIGAILGYMDQLRAVDLSGVEPLFSPLEATGAPAADEPGPTLPVEAVMALAPDTMPPFIKVPKVLGDGGGLEANHRDTEAQSEDKKAIQREGREGHEEESE